MKKIVVLLAGVMMLVSCGSTGSGLLTGASFGSVIGSCIGGISGGPHGSCVGTLVGMATGAAAGAAIGHANEQQYYAQADEIYSSNSSYSRATSLPSQVDESGYSNNPVYDDAFVMDTSSSTSATASPDTAISINALKNIKEEVSPYALTIENVQFINSDNTAHIAKGELVKIAFELRNSSKMTLTNLVPTIQETTKNKRIFISPSTMIQSLAPGKILRYTAYVSAQRNLKTGTAHFLVSVTSNGTTISNVIEFDVALN